MARSRVVRSEDWIKSFDEAFDGLDLRAKLRESGIQWNRDEPEDLLRGLLVALWMRARSIAQSIEMALAAGVALPKKGTYRFIGERSIDLRSVLRACFDADTTSEDDIILIDDTPARRTGYQLPGVSFFRSASLRAQVLGYQVVTLFHYGREASGFLDFEISISKRTPRQSRRRGRPVKEILKAKRTTKYDLVLEMLDRARKAGNKARIVVFDSWYGQSTEFLLNLLCKRLHFVTQLKTNRRLLWDGEYLSIKKIWAKLKRQKRRFKNFDGRTRFHAFESDLPGFGHLRAILVRFTDKTGKRRRTVLICDHLDWSPEFIIERYLDRSTIEQGYKVSKQDLGLNDAHVETIWGQVNLMTLTFLAYRLASSVRIREGTQRSVAGILLWARKRVQLSNPMVVIRLLMRRLENRSPQSMISTSTLETWIRESMMATGLA